MCFSRAVNERLRRRCDLWCIHEAWGGGMCWHFKSPSPPTHHRNVRGTVKTPPLVVYNIHIYYFILSLRRTDSATVGANRKFLSFLRRSSRGGRLKRLFPISVPARKRYIVAQKNCRMNPLYRNDARTPNAAVSYSENNNIIANVESETSVRRGHYRKRLSLRGGDAVKRE